MALTDAGPPPVDPWSLVNQPVNGKSSHLFGAGGACVLIKLSGPAATSARLGCAHSGPYASHFALTRDP
eukprot:4125147-Amphidinium_carterae.3